MSDDLVKRLRDFAFRSQRGSHNQSRWQIIMEAADEIERLRALTEQEGNSADNWCETSLRGLGMLERAQQRAEAKIETLQKAASYATEMLASKLEAAEAREAKLREAARGLISFIEFSTGEFGSHEASLIETIDGLHWSAAAWRLRRALQDKSNG